MMCLVHLDPVTKIPTRHALGDYASRLPPSALPGVLAVLDLDHLRALNTRWTHDAGDAVLTAVAQRLAAACTDQEAVARWGGEEFALLLTAVEEASARARVEALRAVVGTVRVPWEGRNLRITASVGAVWLRATRVNLAPYPIDQYMARAITAVRAAKQAGRHRTVWHGAETHGEKG